MCGDSTKCVALCGGAFIEAFSQGLASEDLITTSQASCPWVRTGAMGDKSEVFIWWCPFFGSVFLGK